MMTKPEFSYLAPGACGQPDIALPGASNSARPGLDEHVVEPETRREMIDGLVVYASPARAPHADRNAELDYVLRAHVADDCVASTDLLTRVSREDNFATDASIRKQQPDTTTGRSLEEIVFEVKYTQTMADVELRARKLSARGVRRIFVICVSTEAPGARSAHAGPVLEWSSEHGHWVPLSEHSFIEDPCLSQPLKVRALLDAAEADDAVARALIGKRTAAIVEHEAETYELGQSDGYRRGLCESILDLCDVLNIEVSPARRERLDAMTVTELRALRTSLKAGEPWPAG